MVYVPSVTALRKYGSKRNARARFRGLSYRMKRTRRKATTGTRLAKSKTFKRAVTTVEQNNNPMQYRLFSSNDTTATPDNPFVHVSQTPFIIMNLSNVKFNNENTNLKYVRTSPKMRPINLHINMTFLGADTPYSRICLALVRHKRAQPIQLVDIVGPTGAGALTTANDKPFLPCTNATANNTFPNDIGCNMEGGLNPHANPVALNSLGWNPKVVDVLKTWNVTLQTKDRLTDGTGTIGVTYPSIKEIEYNHRFPKDEEWRFENRTSPDDNTEFKFPYNNKCYQIIAFSDSVALTTHPTVSVHCRLSFKDID